MPAQLRSDANAPAVGIVQRLHGDPGGAIQSQQTAIGLFGPDPAFDLDRAQARTESARSLVELGRAAEAPAGLDEVLLVHSRLQTEITPAHADTLLAKGRALLATDRPGEPWPALEAVASYWRRHSPGSRWAAEAERWLART